MTHIVTFLDHFVLLQRVAEVFAQLFIYSLFGVFIEKLDWLGSHSGIKTLILVGLGLISIIPIIAVFQRLYHNGLLGSGGGIIHCNNDLHSSAHYHNSSE